MRILITGGTGSLGHGLARSLLAAGNEVVVFSRDEYKQAMMRETIPDERLMFRLGDVRDGRRMEDAFQHVDIVVHAAALKRVDAVCNDTEEVCKTNIQGTQNALHAAVSAGVKKFLLVSSDKACAPSNAYGVSKAMAEWLTVGFNAYGYPRGLRSSVVRYGNVLGSRGSVVQVWRDHEGPLPITDLEMTRFLITMPQAVGLVEAVLDCMEGGEIFVPRLPAAKMWDVAKALRGEGMPVTITGLRPGGEKLHETLLTEQEAQRSRDLGAYISATMPFNVSWRVDEMYAEEPRTVDGERRSDLSPPLSVEFIRNLLKHVPTEGV